MTTWGTINSDLSLFLQDDGGASFTEPLRIAAFNRACEFFAISHTANFKSASATASEYLDGTKVSFPADFIQLPDGGVQSQPTEVSEPSRWLTPYAPTYGEEVPKGGYILQHDGIYLPGGDATVQLWYYAKYDLVIDTDSVINLPAWATWAVMLLTLAYILIPRMVSQADLRQFQSRRDAGSPEDNPGRRQADWFLKAYHEIVDRVSPQDRAAMPGNSQQ